LSLVSLYGRTYPATVGTLLATVRARSDGSFSFARRPDRDTSYYVQAGGGASSIPVLVEVDTRADIETRTLAFGQVVVRVRVFHPPDLDWDGARVSWAFASGAGDAYRRAPDTQTIRVAQDVDLLSTTATLPPGPFRWRACFDAPGAEELEDPEPVGECEGQGFSGDGAIPRQTGGFPTPADIARAERYLSTRRGHTALAVVNTNGRVSGVNLDEQFITGSVVKAMLLVAYLRRLNAMGQRAIDSASNALLVPMIEVSDNSAATHIWDIVGNAGLDAVAKAAGMTHFSPDGGNGTEWGAALITARDQARFFWEMDSLIPREFVPYARNLLSHIAPFETWGIPTVARRLGYRVFFKAGWRPSPDIFLVHQIARLEKDGHRFALAVMSDGDPDMTYGIDTIEGTTAALLGAG
jgi:Beta-lactamase enzyme family